MWVAHPPPRALPYNRRQQNIHPRDRPDGRRCSCDVEVLGVAVPPGSEDFHHERRREAAAPGAVGHAVGRRRRRRAVPGREDRQGLPPRHVPLPPRELGLRSERHNSKLIKRLPDPENPLAAVNRLCYLLRLFLDSHTGFDRTRLGGYLDLFWVMMNPPRDKMEKAAFVLDRAMRNPKTLRYRDFYARPPSSDDEGSSS